MPAAAPTPASNGCEVGRREAAGVFAAALLFRLAVFLAVAALACLVLYPGTGLSWATDIWKKWDAWHYVGPVSYTHLDVYKRQALHH